MKDRFAFFVLIVLPLVLTSCGTTRNSLAQFGKFRLTAFTSRHNDDTEKFGNASLEPKLGFVEALAMTDEMEGATVVAAAGDTQNPKPTPALYTTTGSAALATFSPTPGPVLTTATVPSASQSPGAAQPAPPVYTEKQAEQLKEHTPHSFVVKTTAYTHGEADSLQYGTKNAAGGELKFGAQVRSAAADWSRFPVGTRFKIKGLPYEYVVDDYGRALVGTDTIDLYKPDASLMNRWGAREVGIEVLEWGSFNESKKILESRKNKPNAGHVREMLKNIDGKMPKIPEALRDGFDV